MSTATFVDAVASRLRPWRVTADRDAPFDGRWRSPWILVDFPPARPLTDRWEAPARDRVIASWQVTCVAEDRATAVELSDRVGDLLVDWTPIISGWMCHPVLSDWAPRVLPPYTDAPDRVLWEAVSGWTWHATRRH